eukprot:gene14635-17663_t
MRLLARIDTVTVSQEEISAYSTNKLKVPYSPPSTAPTAVEMHAGHGNGPSGSDGGEYVDVHPRRHRATGRRGRDRTVPSTDSGTDTDPAPVRTGRWGGRGVEDRQYSRRWRGPEDGARPPARDRDRDRLLLDRAPDLLMDRLPDGRVHAKRPADLLPPEARSVARPDPASAHLRIAVRGERDNLERARAGAAPRQVVVPES